MPNSGRSRSPSPTGSHPHSKRHSRSDSGTDKDDRPTQRRRNTPDERVRIGKHAARTLRISFRGDLVLRDGFQHFSNRGWDSIDIEGDPFEGLDDPFSNVGLFLALVKQIPGCIERLKSDDDEGTYRANLAAALEKGANTARSDDCSGLKVSILPMVEDIVEKKILHKFKYTRGFHDKGIGKLLCPPSFDWDDPSVQSRLKNGDVRPSTAEYPPFLYHSYSINPENKLDGLFQSELLIKAARHIFIAPSAAEDTEAYVKSTRPGNAALNNMSAVTVPTIAYVSVLVRFSLSSEETFNIRLTGARGGFDHWAFYKNIIKFLLDPKMKDKTADLIAFWNSRIFGPREGDEEVDHDTAAEILAGL